MPRSQKLVQIKIDFATINVLETTISVCATVALRLHISKIMNYETDLLPLRWKSSLKKLTLNFVIVCNFDFKQPIFEFFRTIWSEDDAPRNKLLGFEIDRKTECSIFDWEFLKVLVLWITASQQVDLSAIKKTKFTGKTTLPQHPMKHF